MALYEVAQLVVPMMDFVSRWPMFSDEDRTKARAAFISLDFEPAELAAVLAFCDALDKERDGSDETPHSESFFAHVGNIGNIGAYPTKDEAVRMAEETIRNSGRADNIYAVFNEAGELVAEGRLSTYLRKPVG